MHSPKRSSQALQFKGSGYLLVLSKLPAALDHNDKVQSAQAQNALTRMGGSEHPGVGEGKPLNDEVPEEISCAISSPAFLHTKSFRSDAFLKLICVNI